MAYQKVIILGEVEQVFLKDLLMAYKAVNDKEHKLNPNDIIILNCLIDKAN